MDRSVGRLRASLGDRGWPVATVPSRVLLYFVLAETAALVCGCLALADIEVKGHAAGTALFMTLLAVFFEEVVSRLTRLEIRLGPSLRRDMTSVWTVSAAVVLPPAYAVLVVAILTAYIWIRQYRPAGRPLHRSLFNASGLVLTTLIVDVVSHRASSAFHGLPWALGAAFTVVVAMVVNAAVNRLLASVALALLGVPMRELRGTRHDNLLEFATLCLGGLVAIAALESPWLCVLALAPMVTLQRGALVRELEAAATIDKKTGMLNAVAWEQVAQRELEHARRDAKPLGILVIDLDRFKLVNDSYGHLVGDEVLGAVGRCLSEEIREFDTVGRFGGEEFVVVLPSASETDALIVAERLRSKINDLRISALVESIAPEPDDALAISIGVSCAPTHGEELADLLVAADAALYRAKAAGRNRVVLADPGRGNVFERIVRS